MGGTFFVCDNVSLFITRLPQKQTAGLVSLKLRLEVGLI